MKAFVFVVDGTVARVRAVKPDGEWTPDDRGYYDAPLNCPLSEVEIARKFPTLGLALDAPRPHQRGKFREYLPL